MSGDDHSHNYPLACPRPRENSTLLPSRGRKFRRGPDILDDRLFQEGCSYGWIPYWRFFEAPIRRVEGHLRRKV